MPVAQKVWQPNLSFDPARARRKGLRTAGRCHISTPCIGIANCELKKSHILVRASSRAVKIEGRECAEAVKDGVNEVLISSSGAFILLMRWTGLAISDSLKLPRTALQSVKDIGKWRVQTSRQKTGTHVEVVGASARWS